MTETMLRTGIMERSHMPSKRARPRRLAAGRSVALQLQPCAPDQLRSGESRIARLSRSCRHDACAKLFVEHRVELPTTSPRCAGIGVSTTHSDGYRPPIPHDCVHLTPESALQDALMESPARP